jgi:hypothetical protein
MRNGIKLLEENTINMDTLLRRREMEDIYWQELTKWEAV